MQIIKPSTLRLIWEFAWRDADFTAGFRNELAQWVCVMWRLYGHQLVRERYLEWAREKATKR